MAIRKRKKIKKTKKTKIKRKTKAQTKRELERKIAQLESKLSALSGVPAAPPSRKTKARRPTLTKPTALVSNLPENAGIMSGQPRFTKPGLEIPTFLAPPEIKPQVAPPPPPPPKPAETTPPPKPAEPTPPPPVTMSQAMENAWYNYPMTSTHDYKTKTPGFSPSPNRYYGRRTAPAGTAPTQNWNLQKEKITGFTAPSNQYFATRTRLSYHPSDKTFTGYGLQIEGATAQAEAQKPSSTKGSLPKGF